MSWLPIVAILVLAPAAAPAQSKTTWEGKTVEQWAAQLADKDIRARWYASYVLGQLGPKAAEAVAPLHKILETRSENEYVRGNAAWALGRICRSPETEIPLLTETLQSQGHISVRRNSAEALGNYGEAAKAAVPRLVKALDDADLVTQVNAAVALWKIERHPKAVPALVEILRRGKSPGPYQVAVALGRLGADPESVAPALVEALHHPDADVRRAAARSIGQIGRPAFAALKAQKALDDPSEEVRCLVVESLAWMGPEAVKPLIAALSDKGSSVRRAAARALGELGPDAIAAENALVETVNDPKAEVRDAAAKALRQIRVEGKKLKDEG
jgi:HEAT repeat protein